jgi:diguanylate cyclase (GGDEF)-like protein
MVHNRTMARNASLLLAAARRIATLAPQVLAAAALLLMLVVPLDRFAALAADKTAPDGLQLAAFCHGSTAIPPPALDHDVPGGLFCGGDVENYQTRSLWLVGGARMIAAAGPEPVLMVHSSRFDRLLVGFRYADGVIAWQDVRAGNYGSHWRLGGQLAFAAPLRDARLVGLVIRADRLAAVEILRMRMVPAATEGIENIALACLIGATLMLLVIGAIYNLALGIAARRLFPVLQGLWSLLMAAWGVLWSQLHLFVVPGMAGTLSAQIATALALGLLMMTAFSLVSALEPGTLPRWLGRLALVLAALLGVAGLPLSLLRTGDLLSLAYLVAALLTALALVIVVCLAVAWRRGSTAARAFAGAWIVPLLAMSLTAFFELGDSLWGGGEQMLVLLSGAWQSLWLALAATRRITLMRRERDAARAAEAIAQDQARRDPLTGLVNRRGFVDRIEPLLAQFEPGQLALLLLDVDQFKAVNDRHGHDVGDRVLTTIARLLEQSDGPGQVVARLGGEEFAIMVAGMGLFAVHGLAETLRQAIAACDHGDAVGAGEVTVSIGLVMAGPEDSFATLYRAADTALYAAKRQGRNRVIIARSPGETLPPPPAAALGDRG